MQTFIAQATIKGGLQFKSDYHKASFSEWLKTIVGKDVRIELAKNPVSTEMRGYYFGAVIPIVRKTCKEWEKLTGDELHEVLKKQFCYFDAWNNITKRTERFGQPVMSERSTTQKAMIFLQDIAGYLAECGLTMPDPELYKKFRDSAPTIEKEEAQEIDYPASNESNTPTI
jgi:hypothetical protein